MEIIGRKAFYGLRSLKYVTIGKRVNTIRYKAFAGTYALEKVIVRGKYLNAEGLEKSVWLKAGSKSGGVIFVVPAKMAKAYEELLGKYGVIKKAE